MYVCLQSTDPIQPASVLNAPIPSLRACGLSERKASYLVDLAEHFQDGSLSDARIAGKEAICISLKSCLTASNHFHLSMFPLYDFGWLAQMNSFPVPDSGLFASSK
jgi:hypothetical protein